MRGIDARLLDALDDICKGLCTGGLIRLEEGDDTVLGVEIIGGVRCVRARCHVAFFFDEILFVTSIDPSRFIRRRVGAFKKRDSAYVDIVGIMHRGLALEIDEQIVGLEIDHVPERLALRWFPAQYGRVGLRPIERDLTDVLV